MTTEAASGEGEPMVGTPAVDTAPADELSLPTAGMVLHRVLAKSARMFLLNDVATELADDGSHLSTVDALSLRMGTRPLWAQSASSALDGTQRRSNAVERIHQSRVAMRRIRSNLRTFRLAVDPAWGTALRAELSWYGGRLGEVRDLHVLDELLRTAAPEVLTSDEAAWLEAVVSARTASALEDVAVERVAARRFQLTEQMMVLWDGPVFRPKTAQPARDVLPPMLDRAWHDLRGAARTARKDSSDANLHKLRVRLKDLRYGCETVALVEGGPARKTAKAAERLQSKLGGLHDASFTMAWLDDLAREHPDFADPAHRLVSVEREAAAAARQGWKKELKEVERRWRKWQG